jgi:anti-sigma factor RsiW
MHCKDWEERVALHGSGDLTAAEAAGVERHLAECAGCRTLRAGMKESLDMLQAAHAEALAPGIYTSVRERVMAGLEAELASRNVWWRRGWLVRLTPVVLAAVVVVMLASWPVRRVETLPPRVAAVIPPASAPVSQPLRPAQGDRQEPDRQEPSGLAHRAHVAGHAGRPRVVKPAQVGFPRQPLLVRLVTDDPNVVIYWIAD